MTKKKDTMEYEEAPSGYVVLNQYKEPFMPYDGGFGYRGVLLFDGKSDKVQCHECGVWLGYLPNHLHKEHNMRASEYKKRVGLRKTTALISESNREKLIANGLEARKANLRPGGKKSEATKEKIRATMKRITDEKKNEVGTCPLQLLDRLLKLHDKLGRTPKQREIGFYDALVREHGNFKTACMRAGISYRKPGANIVHSQLKYTKTKLKKMILEFWDKEHQAPSRIGLLGKNNSSTLYKRFPSGEWDKLINEALNGDGRFRHGNGKFRYTDDDLLQYLRTFQKDHSRVPRPSDTRRGLLPSVQTYHNRFGSFVKAREQAGIIDDE